MLGLNTNIVNVCIVCGVSIESTDNRQVRFTRLKLRAGFERYIIFYISTVYNLECNICDKLKMLLNLNITYPCFNLFHDIYSIASLVATKSTFHFNGN